jgi:hypothetical protein
MSNNTLIAVWLKRIWKRALSDEQLKAATDPLSKYKITDLTPPGSTINYYGFESKTGAWVMMKENKVTGTYRYAYGASDYPAAWIGQEDLQYGYFSSLPGV